MKKIKIFLGSSIVEFRSLRTELNDFVSKLSNLLEKYEIELEMLRCDDGFIMPFITNGGTQKDAIDPMIYECDTASFLVGKRYGKYTEGEFDLAERLHNESENNMPSIAVFFLENCESEENVKSFYERLVANHKYYVLKFSSSDDVKKEILAGIAEMSGGLLKLSRSGNKIKINGEEIVDVKYIDDTYNSQILEDYKKRKNLLIEQKKILSEEVERNSSIETLKKYAILVSQMEEIDAEITRFENDVFHHELDFICDITHGKCTKRELRAYSLLNDNDIHGCMEELSLENIEKDREREIEELQRKYLEEIKKSIYKGIHEKKTLINIIENRKDLPEKAEILNEYYLSIWKDMLKYHLGYMECLDYLFYLKDASDETFRAKVILLEKELSLNLKDYGADYIIDFYLDLNRCIKESPSLLNMRTENMSKAERCVDRLKESNYLLYLEKLLMITAEEMASSDDTYDGTKSVFYENRLNEISAACVNYTEIEEIKTAAQNILVTLFNHLCSTNNISDLQMLLSYFEKEDSLVSVIMKLKYSSIIGDYNNTVLWGQKLYEYCETIESPKEKAKTFVILASCLEHYDNSLAIKYHLKANTYLEVMYSLNKEMYVTPYEQSCYSLASLYAAGENMNPDLCIKHLEKTSVLLEERKRMAPDLIGSDYGRLYDTYSIYYQQTGDTEKSIKYAELAVSEMVRITPDSQSFHYPYYIHVLLNLGLLYKDTGWYDKAIGVFLELLKKIKNYEGRLLQESKIGSYDGLGQCYLKKNDYKKAILYFEKVHKVGKRYAEDPNHMNDYLSLLYDLSHCYFEEGDKQASQGILMDMYKISKNAYEKETCDQGIRNKYEKSLNGLIQISLSLNNKKCALKYKEELDKLRQESSVIS